MRLFTGLDLPENVVGNLEELVRVLKPAAPVAWTPPSNLHITTKFIGEWPEDRLPELQRALGALPARSPFPIQMRNVGFYPNPHSPRVFFAGIEAPPDLALAR